ncbi:multidrug ABC transporter ATP-binding protein [Boudabousia liubingyangii]|uniref:Multidrug ABC transporter ATP-binding protein n=1 Tax=Boudabousia liubingyangii TaxID=1921764 RepID=A0A1Q5PQH7_9ACTO|nr:ABC transporter ATP-binding protein [Boudabousia liubingyangii]OKL49660.1 multidrug ABC transporter ATP-binding protein [Boudabousia liubingyangii]
MLFRLLKYYAKPYKWEILLVVFLQIVQTIANLWLPSLNADIIDKGVVTGDTGKIMYYGWIMLGMTGIQLLASLMALYFGARTGTRMGHDIRRDTFATVQKFSRTEMHDFEAASLITRATNDIQQIQGLTIMGLTFIIMSPIMGIGGVIMAIRQDAGLSLLLIVVVPLLAVVMGILMYKLQPLFKLSQKRTDAINAVLREQLTGARVIRAFVRQEAESERFNTANQNLRDTNLGIGKVFSIMNPAVNLIIGLASSAVIWFGAIRIDSGNMEVGAMVAFLNYLMQIFFAVMVLSFMFMMIPRAAVCADRCGEVLKTKPVISSDEGAIKLPAPQADSTPATFAFEDVSVQYPGAEVPVIAGISAVLKPGTTTAVIGSTGSGKSTLAALLPRLIDPSEGRISVNGKDLREYDLPTLRQHIAYVPQTAYLFSGTIASSVASLPEDQITDQVKERVRFALEAAQAWEFVSRLDDGMDAHVDTGGKNFSGGQRQRLTIARALYRHADLYIFDDSFSALDYATEARLRAALPEAIGDAAVFMVAQRVSTIELADQIMVIDAGRLVGLGKHQELLETCETYKEIVDSQIDAEEAAK